jgi:hypothetical protein
MVLPSKIFCFFAQILPVRAARRVSGQRPVDDFLHEEGQIRLGKRQARRQAIYPQNRQKPLVQKPLDFAREFSYIFNVAIPPLEP